ncbi:MAG: MEKHLA domain-containing protein [Gammaproteobacteria bacterium]|nr:MEKHLA domain-containing protein [Gammaproteobacteria bacterium]MBU1777685.1 MEKHLA domain-containing protein [Gammaproteobacteria bacterium]
MPSLKLSDAALDARLRLIVESYRRLTGKELVPSVGAMWNAPFAIVAHGTEADPVFFYGNEYALRCFEMDFDEFTCLPSRLSAEPMAQESREKALRKVAEQGYIDGYSGMRIAKSGRRFMIADCTIWNLEDAAGAYQGQAAVFVISP